MTSTLFDIAPPSETVTINGRDEKVVGLPFRIVVQLIKDNPDLTGLLVGGGLSGEAIINRGPDVAAQIIAAGYGMPDDEKAKQTAANLPLDVQLDLIAGILKATLGGGVGPFVQKITALQKVVEAEKPKEEVRKEKLEIVKRRLTAMQSRRPSNSSSRKAATNEAICGI